MKKLFRTICNDIKIGDPTSIATLKPTSPRSRTTKKVEVQPSPKGTPKLMTEPQKYPQTSQTSSNETTSSSSTLNNLSAQFVVSVNVLLMLRN